MRVRSQLLFRAPITLLAIVLIVLLVCANGPSPSSAASATIAGSRKYALLVGISKYARGSTKTNFDWWNLNTKADLEIMADVLIRRFNFRPEDVTVISDEPVTVGDKVIPPTKPTKQAIEQAVKTALIDRVAKGDVAYFHYSGHGNQAPDDKDHGPNPQLGDEADGMDETLIPADYVSQTDPSRDIRDDSISEWLAALSAKEPSNVTVTLDSCHSGTATRGDEVVRGGYWKGDPVDPKLLAKRDDSVADFVTTSRTRGSEAQGQNYIFIAAASPTQTAKEQVVDGIPYGKFTYNLARMLENAGPGTTYRDLFENVSNAITRDQRAQIPQIEGRRIDQLVFAAGALPVERFVPVRVSGSNVYLQAGRLQGMTAGSRFALYPAGAKRPEEGKQIATVVIERVNPATSILKIPEGVSVDSLRTAARAFEVEHSYGEVLKVAVRETPGTGRAAFDKVFEELGLAERIPESSGTWNVLLRPRESNGPEVTSSLVTSNFKGYVLERHDGSIIKAVEDGPTMLQTIAEALKSEAMWQLVKSLDDTQDPELASKIELALVPVKIDMDEVSGDVLGISDLTAPISERGGKKEVRACLVDAATDRCKPNTGDFVRLEIRNTSDRPLWVTILNLRSDGKIGPAFPMDNADNKIAPNSTFKIPYPFRFRAPFGEESFRAIVTANQTDFTPLIDPQLLRGEESVPTRNAAASPLGAMLRQAAAGKRGDPVAPPATWATAHVTYYIVPGDKK